MRQHQWPMGTLYLLLGSIGTHATLTYLPVALSSASAWEAHAREGLPPPLHQSRKDDGSIRARWMSSSTPQRSRPSGTWATSTCRPFSYIEVPEEGTPRRLCVLSTEPHTVVVRFGVTMPTTRLLTQRRTSAAPFRVRTVEQEATAARHVAMMAVSMRSASKASQRR